MHRLLVRAPRPSPVLVQIAARNSQADRSSHPPTSAPVAVTFAHPFHRESNSDGILHAQLQYASSNTTTPQFPCSAATWRSVASAQRENLWAAYTPIGPRSPAAKGAKRPAPRFAHSILPWPAPGDAVLGRSDPDEHPRPRTSTPNCLPPAPDPGAYRAVRSGELGPARAATRSGLSPASPSVLRNACRNRSRHPAFATGPTCMARDRRQRSSAARVPIATPDRRNRPPRAKRPGHSSRARHGHHPPGPAAIA